MIFMQCQCCTLSVTHCMKPPFHSLQFMAPITLCLYNTVYCTYYIQHSTALYVPITSPCSCTNIPRSLNIWLTSVMSA